MAKSQIIKDLAMGKKDIFTALKVLKVILCDLEMPEISSWVEHELSGYTLKDDFPEYRKGHGTILGSFFVGYMQYSNLPMPTSHVDSRIIESLSSIYITQSVKAINDLILKNDSKSHFARILPSSSYRFFTKDTNITSIIKLEAILDQTVLQNVIAAVESRLLDAFIILEKQLGILDSLDFSIELEQKTHIETQIRDIIFTDNSIRIGDNNRIDNSVIKTGVKENHE